MNELDRWAADRAADLIARAEAEAVAELKAALLRAAAAQRRGGRAPATAARRATAPTATPPAAAASRPASVTGDALWAYCVARDDAALAGGGPGVHPDGQLAWVREGGLAVLCSRVPLAEFGEEPLRRNLNELPWLERTARAHEAAIGAAFEHAAVVPCACARSSPTRPEPVTCCASAAAPSPPRSMPSRAARSGR